MKTQKTITRKEAKAQNLTRYFTGKPCKHGHNSERFVSNGECVYCHDVRKGYITPTEKKTVRKVVFETPKMGYLRWKRPMIKSDSRVSV